MRLEELRTAVCAAHIALNDSGLVVSSFGNASGIDRQQGIVAIKPSGVPYAELTPEKICLVDMDGEAIEDGLRPSSDTRTHCALYRVWDSIGGVVHTHSTEATAWCQACEEIPCYGTTHADYSGGCIPCAIPLNADETAGDYEAATGEQILRCFGANDPMSCPMILVGGHAPFTWGKDAAAAVESSIILEQIARMARLTRQINPRADTLPAHIHHKHWQRKHGENAYYGQEQIHAI